MLFKNFNRKLEIIVLNFWVLKKIFKLSIKHVEHSGFLINHSYFSSEIGKAVLQLNIRDVTGLPVGTQHIHESTQAQIA